MKRIIIASLVATIIFFGWQTTAWMTGINAGFYSYTPKQDSIMKNLSAHLTDESMYYMPMPDPKVKMSMSQSEAYMKQYEGKPWAMVFYHPKSDYSMGKQMIKGLLFAFICAFLVSYVLANANFHSVLGRFMVSMFFSLFALITGPLTQMNWWDFPWHFIQPAVLDHIVGWGIASAWLAWYIRPEVE